MTIEMRIILMIKKKSRNIEINELIRNYEKIVESLYNIATDPKTDRKTLTRLSVLSDSYIQSGIIFNPNVSSNILERMLDLHSGVGGTDEERRIHIVYNPALREVILRRVIEKDKSSRVREAALSALDKRMAINNNAGLEHNSGQCPP
jgi:hypothetical protein